LDPGKCTLVVTLNYSIDECFGREQDHAAMRELFWEIAMTEENRKRLLVWLLNRSISRQETVPPRFERCSKNVLRNRETMMAGSQRLTKLAFRTSPTMAVRD
jgi:hypothetical protein